ncbi:RES family NAD+ phosphorylase [Cellulophaga baltica]|uniref:RES family NAD+ phosphorylase n=1 Tax=Cellulophaga baltica TaxID=76594 RepID=UPI0024943BD3|nr:RES family NAD+ phosphorylase [Cellulophaga baltica]
MTKEICSKCFNSEGLKLMSLNYGKNIKLKCKNCGELEGLLISKTSLEELAHKYFIEGTYYNTEYGGSPLIQYNEYQKTDVDFGKYLNGDIKIFEDSLKIGFFYYAPRLFMLGEIEPLKKLENTEESISVLNEIIEKFPTVILTTKDYFYRLRTNPEFPHLESEYDSPPIQFSGTGRLDNKDFNVFYGSKNIEICFHECRVSIIDNTYIAKLRPIKNLKLLNLNSIINETNTEFESLGLSIHFIFRAENHSYEICRRIARFVFDNGFDGIIFPSYFSKVKGETIPNIALFGKPITDNKINVESIDRALINTVKYDYSFGPLIIEEKIIGNTLYKI